MANPDSSGSATYSVVLVIANTCFFLAAFSNTWFVARDAMAKPEVSVRLREENYGFLGRVTCRLVRLFGSMRLCLYHRRARDAII